MKVVAVVCVVLFVVLGVAFGLKDPLCGLPHDAGDRCLEWMSRHHFDSESNSCLEFLYGGCGGNNNRFETEEECENKCKE